MANKKQNKVKAIDRTVKIEHEINLTSLLLSILDQHNVKTVLKHIGIISLTLSQDKIIFPANFFATQTDVDNLQTAIILKYVRDHWDLTYKQAFIYWKQLLQKSSKELTEKSKQ